MWQISAKKDARKALREVERMVERGTYLSGSGIPTFFEVADKWLEYKKPNLRASTCEQYKGHLENHQKPYYGLTRITIVKGIFSHGRFYEPKSTTSRRSIDLGSMVMAELRKWRVACPPSGIDLVFPRETGSTVDSNNMVKREFFPALRRAGLRRIRFHDLRHTYATLLIAQGEHPKYIQTQMGHSSIKVTMDTYGHLMESVNREASKKLEEAVLGESGDILETKTKQALRVNR